MGFRRSSNTTGSTTPRMGLRALLQHHRLQQHREWGRTLYSNTTGPYNTANGYQAGRYIADGVTANQTSSNSVYEGFQAYPLASGDTNENVIGNAAIGHGSNTTTLGNAATVGTWLAGTLHRVGTAPTSNVGTVTGTNSGGAVAGLSSAASVTITFANSGWATWAACVATADNATALPYISAQSTTAVTITFTAAETGTVYYHCDGN